MSRFVRVLWLGLALLVSGGAVAGELAREIHLHDGTVVTGVVVERGDGYLVIAQADGVMLELATKDIAQVRVVEAAEPARTWTPEPTGPIDRYDPDDELSWDDDEPAERVLDPARAAAKRGHALTVAPVIPLMMSGIGVAGMGSITRIPGLAIGGGLLGTGAFVFSAVGGWQAWNHSGRPKWVLPAYVVGLSLQGTGVALYHGAMSITSGLSRDADVAGFPYLIGPAIGLQIGGMIVTAFSAKASRDVAREEREERRAAVAPWLLPREGGVTIGLAGVWPAPRHGGSWTGGGARGTLGARRGR